MECPAPAAPPAPPAPPSFISGLSIGVLIGIAGTLLLLLFSYGIYECTKGSDETATVSVKKAPRTAEPEKEAETAEAI